MFETYHIGNQRKSTTNTYGLASWKELLCCVETEYFGKTARCHTTRARTRFNACNYAVLDEILSTVRFIVFQAF